MRAVKVTTGELLWQDSFPVGQDLSVNHISGLLVYQNYLVVAPDPSALMLNGTQLFASRDLERGHRWP